MTSLAPYLDRLPLVAILRGVTPAEVVGIGRALVDAGFSIIEVPLNSPEPVESIRRLAGELGPDILVGAGTVTNAADVEAVAAAGGRIIVMPHADVAVIRVAKAAGLALRPRHLHADRGLRRARGRRRRAEALPGGADHAVGSAGDDLGLPAWHTLPAGRGDHPRNDGPYLAAGAAGFGLGSALYKPGMTATEVARTAAAFATAWRRNTTDVAAGDRP